MLILPNIKKMQSQETFVQKDFSKCKKLFVDNILNPNEKANCERANNEKNECSLF